MTKFKDIGVIREEHKIIYQYLPGQLVSHFPQFSARTKKYLGVLSTRVYGLKNIYELNSHNPMLKMISNETEPKLRALMNNPLVPIKYYRCCDNNKKIIISLEPYPQKFSYKNKVGVNKLIDLQTISTKLDDSTALTQLNIVFCNAFGSSRPYITDVDIANATGITNAVDLDAKRLTYVGNSPQPLHANRVTNWDKQGWAQKPRFASERSNFIPAVRSDVYPPEMEKTSAKKLFEFLADEKVLIKNSFGNIDEKVMAILQIVIDFKDFSFLQNTAMEFRGTCFDKLEQACKDFFSLDSIKSDSLKLKIIKLESTQYKDFNEFQEKFDIYYCEKLSIANFAVGYYSGEYPDLEEHSEGVKEASDKEVILRKFDGEYKSEFDSYILHGSMGDVWPIFYNTFKTEGLLFIPKEKIIKKFEIINDLKAALHTISHVLIKNAPKYSGIDEGNLKEFFFEDGSFLLYSVEPGKFRTKGLKRIFDNHIENLFTDAKETLDCPFQYLNTESEHDAGCGACTMLSNNCTNQNLSINKAVKVFE